MFKNNIVTPGYPPFQKDGPFWHLVKGDPEKGFEECAYIAEDTVEFSKMAAPPSRWPPCARPFPAAWRKKRTSTKRK